jgi:hypothetical protein
MNNSPALIAEATEKKQRRLANLRPFPKGVSGNPAGRPPGSVSIVEGIKNKLMEIEPENKKTYLEMFLNKLFAKAIGEGDQQLMRDIINRIDGMPKQTIDARVGELPTPLLKHIDESVSNNDSPEKALLTETKS